MSLNRALRFDAAGRRLGGEVELWQGIGTTVVPLADGGFLAASSREAIPGRDLQPQIRLHRLDPLGRPLGEPVTVTFDQDEFDSNSEPRLAVAPNGTVAVVWSEFNGSIFYSLRVMGRFYNSSLTPITEAFPLSIAGPDVADATPDIAFKNDGTAFAIWERSQVLELDASQIVGRRFNSTGQPLSEVFRISQPETARQQINARIVPAATTGWWAAWNSHDVAGETHEARLLRLSPDGQPLGAEQSLGLPQPSEWRPALGIDGVGNALLLGQSPDRKIVGRLFDRSGAPRSSPFELAASSDHLFGGPVLPDRSSAFTAAWTAFELATSSSDLSGAIFASSCFAGGNAACLGPEGRYGVEVTWQSGAQSGMAKPLPLAESAATFGLRNAADHDVTVVLSGPGSRDFTFAATTGAALTLRVTDQITGEIRTFAKPAGRFLSRRFGFALPSLAINSDTTSSVPSAAGGAAELESVPALPAVGEVCIPSARALCLLGGRFRAEYFSGQSQQPSLALLRTDKSGMFAVPSAPETPRVVLTMIDGRASNGKFWVYLGGLSPSGYKVKITDLATGAKKTYTNFAPQLESRADRTAF